MWPTCMFVSKIRVFQAYVKDVNACTDKSNNNIKNICIGSALPTDLIDFLSGSFVRLLGGEGKRSAQSKTTELKLECGKYVMMVYNCRA